MSLCSKICSLIFADKEKKQMGKNYYLYKATVTRVVDGDTVDLEIDLGMGVFVKERVRLARIDTPETYGVKKDSEEYKAGMKAKERLEELVKGKEIALETVKDKKGKYGRYLGEIYINDIDWTNVNSLLIHEGHAKPY
jgi:micrococcal nuclease